MRNASRIAIRPALPLLGALALLVPTATTRAQDAADAIFDAPAKKQAEPKKQDEPKKAGEAKAKPPAADPKAGAIPNRETIGFNQENVASQMTELEERMFRLSEALQSLEPENASRLRLALKFSREELILQQMRETQKLLAEAQVAKAETEVRELLAKLEHLRDLLLAQDLDFQLKMARLRQMREALGQLERIIKEERRELAWSRNAIEQQGLAEKMRARKADLEALVRDQEAVIAKTEGAMKEEGGGPREEAKAAARDAEAGVRKAAAALAADPTFAKESPAHLKQADPHLEDAATHLGTPDTDAALGSERQALELFKKELERLDARIAEADKAVAEPEFRKFEQDQARNRTATNTLGEVSARLGNSGVALQKDLIRAGGAMQGAEGNLADTKAEPAANDQLTALNHLSKSQKDLAQAMEKLLVELRTELQARIIAELTEMHEIQASIREVTEAQAPRAAEKSRTALITLAGLAKKEAALAEQAERLLVLVEETEFGIALPTSLRVLSREMHAVDDRLKEGDASPSTIKLEKRIEDDLLGLLQAMRRLPPTTPPPPGSPLPSNPRDRERELNRLIAELKMIRLLQSRLNDDTTTVDKTRPEAPPLAAELRREIEDLQISQEEIRDSLSQIGKRVEPSDDGPLPGIGPIDR